MPFSIPQAASALGVLWLDAPAAISAEDGAHILGLYRYDFTGAAPPEPEPETPVVSAGGGGGWHGDYDFRHRPREKKKRPEIVPLAPAAAVVTEDDAEIVALLLMADGY